MSRRRRRPNVDHTEENSTTLTARASTVVRQGSQFWIILSILCATCAFVVFYRWPKGVQHQNEFRGPTDAPFVVVDLPGKGKGAIAARDIQQGELLIREKPLFLVPSQISSSPISLLTERVASLSAAERDSFFNLSSNLPEGSTDSGVLILSIFETNAIAAGHNVGIFPRTARLNHGCSRAFNSVYSWREQEGVIVVHALKAVKKGSELLTTYTNTRRTRAERREFLRQSYHFHCTCEVCSLPDRESQQSDERLKTMTEMYEKLASWAQGRITGKQAIQLINQIWVIGSEEGYWSERGQLAADATLVAVAHSDGRSAREWAALSVEWFSHELGSDSRQSVEIAGTIFDPHSHPSWSLRESADVGGPSGGATYLL